MDDRERKNRLPCIVDEGIVYQHKDMARILRDLGLVRYVDTLGGIEQKSGEGYVSEVVSNSQTGTIIVNGRLYLNTFSFDFLRLSQTPEQEAVFELVDGDRVITVIPLEDGDAPKKEAGPTYQPCLLDRFFEDDYAEVYRDDRDDRDDHDDEDD